MLIIGEAVHGWGQEVYGKSVPSAQLCFEPNTLKLGLGFLIRKNMGFYDSSQGLVPIEERGNSGCNLWMVDQKPDLKKIH